MAECTSATNMFYGCSGITSLTIKNLGSSPALKEMDFTSITDWDTTSLTATLNAVGNRSSYGESFILRFSSSVKSKITSVQISTLQSKGYTIA